MIITQNPDKEYASKVIARLKENDNYCPCRIDRTPDTKCMCKEFRTMIDNGITGYCHCGLYVVDIDH